MTDNLGEHPSRSAPNEALLRIVEDTFSAVGNDFLRVLVRTLAARLLTRYSFITECSESFGGYPVQLRTRAMWMGSNFGEDFEYSVVGTPCEHVLGSRAGQAFSDGIQQSFPDDLMLAHLEVRSYIAIPLLSEDGAVLGHLGAMHVDALQDIDSKFEILSVFEKRASRELERVQAEREMRRRIQKLTLKTNTRFVVPSIVAVCAWCKRIRNDAGIWVTAETFIAEESATSISHGMCVDCLALMGGGLPRTPDS